MDNGQGFDPAVYRKIGYDELVVYAARLLHTRGREVTFENLVAECFENFPERFALRGYDQWPDSSVVNKSWLRCRTDKRYLAGSVKDGFRLTPKGLEAAERVGRLLTSGLKVLRPGATKLTESRTREGRFLRSLEQSDAFRRYQSAGSLSGVTDFDVCDMLLCTLDSAPATRETNLQLFSRAASLYEREDVMKFLGLIRQQFGHLFRVKKAGGMMTSR